MHQNFSKYAQYLFKFVFCKENSSSNDKSPFCCIHLFILIYVIQLFVCSFTIIYLLSLSVLLCFITKKQKKKLVFTNYKKKLDKLLPGPKKSLFMLKCDLNVCFILHLFSSVNFMLKWVCVTSCFVSGLGVIGSWIWVCLNKCGDHSQLMCCWKGSQGKRICLRVWLIWFVRNLLQ